MLIAGEASGDTHGAKLVAALKQLDPQGECFGIGGSNMRAVGCDIIFDANLIAVMGLVEVIKHYPTIKRAWNIALNALKQRMPDLLILIDYPGFNLRFAKKAKALGIKVLYYISPQIWAWHQSRIHKIKKYVDHMVVLFPFELKFYQEANIPVSYFGHPIVEHIQPIESVLARQQLKLDPRAVTFGLLPGSRKSELSRLMPTLIASAEVLQQRYYPHAQFVIPLASTLTETDLQVYFSGRDLDIHLIHGHSQMAMAACDVLIGSSGTVTLEAAILGVPMVIIYKLNALTYWLAKKLIKVKFIGLTNLLADKSVMPELIQEAANVNNIVSLASKFIDDPKYLESNKNELRIVRHLLGVSGAAKQVAALALQLAKKVD